MGRGDELTVSRRHCVRTRVVHYSCFRVTMGLTLPAKLRNSSGKHPEMPDLSGHPRRASARRPTIEARLRRELNAYAVELRKLAYTLPNGVGEYRLLQLSERMSATADEAERSEEAAGAGL